MAQHKLFRVVFLVLVVWTTPGSRAHPWPAPTHPENAALLLSRVARTPATTPVLRRQDTREEVYAAPGTEYSQYQPETAQDTADVTAMAQHFFPSFFPSLGQSRPLSFQNSSPRPAHRSHNGFQPLGFTQQADSSSAQSSLLGSGNFGVIRGGTYYNDADHEQSADYDSPQIYSSYYHNGHGRPAYYNGNPRPQPHSADFFANFRDFADINTPTKSSYSEMYVVYVNKNASQHDPQSSVMVRGDKPKNIIEQLAMIDSEEVTASTVPLKKSTLSAGKLKLAKTFKRKAEKVKTTPKDLYEPLLALS